MLVPLFATVKDFDELGISPEAWVNSSIDDRQKRKGIKAASGRLAPYLRKRHKLPLAVVTDDLDITGSGSATASGKPSKVQDITITIVVGGTVGVPGITYTVTVDGSTGATTNLPNDGKIVVDGVTVTLSGTFSANNTVKYTTGPDWGVREATVAVATYILLHNRGLDPATEQDAKARHDLAFSWAKDLAKGEDAELEYDADSTPNKSEMGPLYTGQKNPWDWVDKNCGGCG